MNYLWTAMTTPSCERTFLQDAALIPIVVVGSFLIVVLVAFTVNRILTGRWF